MKQFTIELKGQEDIQIIVSASSEADAKKKLKRMFKKSAQYDVESNVESNGQVTNTVKMIGNKAKIKKIHQGD